ncbi:MAG TPA: hypothetical protein VD883_03850, partial [Candidatus Omnitrophota bacterium]|nr:hypothetical protein [Candidatus Omnitrophota bacterium]
PEQLAEFKALKNKAAEAGYLQHTEFQIDEEILAEFGYPKQGARLAQTTLTASQIEELVTYLKTNDDLSDRGEEALIRALLQKIRFFDVIGDEQTKLRLEILRGALLRERSPLGRVVASPLSTRYPNRYVFQIFRSLGRDINIQTIQSLDFTAVGIKNLGTGTHRYVDQVSIVLKAREKDQLSDRYSFTASIDLELGNDGTHAEAKLLTGSPEEGIVGLNKLFESYNGRSPIQRFYGYVSDIDDPDSGKQARAVIFKEFAPGLDLAQILDLLKDVKDTDPAREIVRRMYRATGEAMGRVYARTEGILQDFHEKQFILGANEDFITDLLSVRSDATRLRLRSELQDAQVKMIDLERGLEPERDGEFIAILFRMHEWLSDRGYDDAFVRENILMYLDGFFEELDRQKDEPEAIKTFEKFYKDNLEYYSINPDAEIEKEKEVLDFFIAEKKKELGIAPEGARLAAPVVTVAVLRPEVFEESALDPILSALGEERFKVVTFDARTTTKAQAIERTEGPVVVLDETSFNNTGDTRIALIRFLDQIDQDSFAVLNPFVQRLLTGDTKDLSREELGPILSRINRVLPRIEKGEVIVTTQGAFLTFGTVTVQNSPEGILEGLDKLVFEQVTGQDRTEGIRDFTQGFIHYLAKTGFANQIANAKSIAQSLRLSQVDPSFNEAPIMPPTSVPEDQKTIVTQWSVFAKDAQGVPMSLRIQNLNRKAPGHFKHVLLVDDAKILDRYKGLSEEDRLKKFQEDHPYTDVFDKEIIFNDNVRTLETLQRDYVRLGRKMILIADETKDIVQGSPDKTEGKIALLVNLSKDSENNIGILEFAAGYISNPDQEPPSFVKKLADGTLIYLKRLTPIEYQKVISEISRALAQVGAAA